MKIAGYERGGRPSYGFVVGDRIIDHTDVPGVTAASVRELIAARLPDAAALQGIDATIGLDEVTLLPPVQPAKLLCAGVNFPTHRKEVSLSASRPEHPTIFSRYIDSTVGHDVPIVKGPAIEEFDYEGELAVIIGKRAWNVSESEAAEYVFGYSCFNDATAREWQRHSGQWIPGKNFYRSGSFGPYIVTADEVADLGNSTLVTRVNGEVRQSAPIKDMLFSVAELIAYVTTFTPLEPGDVIAAGTPGGVGRFMDPPALLNVGDVVEVEIDGVGLLRNTVAAQA
ncbi:fumarylacetoacetate hydrolase family protein [Thermopolyspora sp. NPDC052614]|uniref:fumarylacetoacetate hydrolase family protein n=1 Tax=Thermopolyspora sp. NPDC052614 TaxID=3155682 RepID=UPI00342C8C64